MRMNEIAVFMLEQICLIRLFVFFQHHPVMCMQGVVRHVIKSGGTEHSLPLLSPAPQCRPQHGPCESYWFESAECNGVGKCNVCVACDGVLRGQAPGERERLLQRERRRRGTLDREGVAPASAMGTSPGYHMEDPLKRIAHQRESYDEAVKKVNPLFDETYNSISGAKEVRRRSASTFLSPAVAAKINTYYVKGFSSTKAVVPEGEATRGGSTGRDTPESSKKTLEDPRASRSSLSGVVSAGDDQGQGGAGSASDEERGGMRRRSAAAFVSRGASAQRWGAETGEDGAARRRRMILPEEVEMYDDESLIHPSGLTRAQSKPRSLHGERK